jgi:hypothetical protein
MSDALTDIARDERRAAAFDVFADRLLVCVRYAQARDRRTLTIADRQFADVVDAVYAAARDVDAVPRGYWNGRTSFAESAAALMEALRAGDERAWASWLRQVYGGSNWKLYGEFKAVSPFVGKFLVYKRHRSWTCDDIDWELYAGKQPTSDDDVFVFDGPGRVVHLGTNK